MGERRARAAVDERPARDDAEPRAPEREDEPNPDGETLDAGREDGVRDVSRVGYAPIVRVDAARREIELCATSEAVDSYGTVFDYEASKDAFSRWLGNVREMHERRAVGRRVAVHCDDETRRVRVTVRISLGARDTWEKVLDGTLRGASIGASNVVWRKQTRSVGGQPRELTVATKYDLVELSLVDNPSNPDALGISIVRDASPDVTLLDVLDPPAPASTDLTPQPPLPPARGSDERALGPYSDNAEGYPDAGVPSREDGRPTTVLGATPEGNAHAPPYCRPLGAGRLRMSALRRRAGRARAGRGRGRRGRTRGWNCAPRIRAFPGRTRRGSGARHLRRSHRQRDATGAHG